MLFFPVIIGIVLSAFLDKVVVFIASFSFAPVWLFFRFSHEGEAVNVFAQLVMYLSVTIDNSYRGSNKDNCITKRVTIHNRKKLKTKRKRVHIIRLRFYVFRSWLDIIFHSSVVNKSV